MKRVGRPPGRRQPHLSMAGVYISFPFCSQKCTYCNFASGVFAKELERAYLAALRRELQAFDWRWRPETLYLGGGTPSRIGEENLFALLSDVPGNPWEEATLEAAPGTVTRGAAECWRRLGINRVSLGVQSFVSGEIRRTGRKHSAEQVASEAAILREEGIPNFNIDLIAGLPGQTPESWRESLDWVERLEAPHVSVYMLEVDEDSRLGREILSGGARYGAGEIPCEESIVEFYETAVDRLRRMGIEQYEISNFARPGMESRHNLKYWRLEPYAGFGAGAHSFDGAFRRANVESPSEYVDRFRRGEPLCAESTPAQTDEERFFVGLRLREGIRPTAGEWERFRTPIERFLGEGLLESDGRNLRLTGQGVLLSNEVFQEFLSI